MDEVLRLVVGGALVLCLVPLLVRPRGTRRRRALDRMGRRTGLAVDPVLGRQVLASRRRLQRGSIVGGLFVWAVGMWALPSVVGSTSSVWLLLAGVVTGGAVGTVAVVVVEAPRWGRESGQRIARPSRTVLADYVSPIERASGLIAVGIVVIGSLVAAAAGVTDPRVLVGPVAVVLLAALLASIGGWFVVSRPQPATSATELAWSDALRSNSLRAIAQTPSVVALCALDVLVYAVPAAHAAGQIEVGVVMLPIVLLLGVQFSVGSRRTRFYLRRLWPVTAAAGHIAGTTA